MLDLNQYSDYINAPDEYKIFDNIGCYEGVTDSAPADVRKAWEKLKHDRDEAPAYNGFIGLP